MIQESNLVHSVGLNIKRIRTELGVTQVELAKRIGSTQSQIGKYERGEQDMGMNRLFQIAEALGISAVDLLQQ